MDRTTLTLQQISSDLDMLNKSVRDAAHHQSTALLDLLSLILQNGHIGWYSVNTILHWGQYQDTAGTLEA
ncbi:MAG: hypothetical protein QW828_07915 [Candidatus Bathyarchaeia archaeon]